MEIIIKGRIPNYVSPGYASNSSDLPGGPPVEINRERKIGPRFLPGITVAEPFIGLFDLPTVFDALRKDAVLVAQSVTVRRKP